MYSIQVNPCLTDSYGAHRTNTSVKLTKQNTKQSREPVAFAS